MSSAADDIFQEDSKRKHFALSKIAEHKRHLKQARVRNRKVSVL